MEDWMHENMHGILIVVEVLWVAGFFSVFVLYFVISRRIKKKKQQQLMTEEVSESHTSK